MTVHAGCWMLDVLCSMPCAVSSWRRPPDTLTLGSGDVHVWRVRLDQTASCQQSLHKILSEDEQARPGQFYFRRDGEHFIAARGLLRVILGRYLGIAPGQLRFSYGPYGKPALAQEYNEGKLRFNISHSDELALYAVTRNREVGVDIERIRHDLEYEQIAEQFFSPREIAMLRALPPQMRRDAFFNCWTRKEAYIKATSKGLSIPLDQFDVSVVPGEPAALLSTRWDTQEASRWSLQALIPYPGYAAALAVEGHSWRLQCWQWPVNYCL